MANMFDDAFTDDIKNDFLQSQIDGFSFSLENFGITSLINGVTKKILIKNRANGNEKEISVNLNDVKIGDIVELKQQKWLAIDLPVENDIYTKAIIKLCNVTFPIQRNTVKTYLGKDRDGRPNYSYAFDTINEPCIASMTWQSDNDSEQMQLPNGFLDITLKYQTGDNIRINQKFKIYDMTYEIINIDYTKVINGNGIMIIRGKREVTK